MIDQARLIHLVRHAETAWSKDGRHTGRTDLPLTERGQDDAASLAVRLVGVTPAEVWTSPLQRARRTCEIAGFAPAMIEPDLVEWDYGAYEGRTTDDIRRERPDWRLFRDGCPGGESVANVADRADRLCAKLRRIDGDVLIFSSGHILRVLVARWLELPAGAGRSFALDTASVSILGYERAGGDPLLRRWNQ